jgi:replicative DNA helicase
VFKYLSSDLQSLVLKIQKFFEEAGGGESEFDVWIRQRGTPGELTIWQMSPRDVNVEFVEQEILRSVRRLQIKGVVSEISSLGDDWEKDESRFEEYVGKLIDALRPVEGSRFLRLRDWEKVLSEELRNSEDKLSLGFEGFGVWFERKELSAFMAGPSMGKSDMLVHLSRIALISGYKVLFITMELYPEKVIGRMVRTIAGVSRQQLREQWEMVKQQLDELQRQEKDEFMVRYLPPEISTTADVEGVLKMAMADGFVPDVLMLDYADLLSASKRFNNRYDEIGSIYRMLRYFAGKYELFLVTASQTNRGFVTSELVADADIADSYQKLMVADNFITITPIWESMSDPIRRLTLFARKVRDRPAFMRIVVNYDPARGRFWVG